jgi:hypothetical protein
MTHVIQKQVVARALYRLREQRTHTLFIGYIHLQQRSAELERLEDLQPDFTSFFKQFLRVGNHPLGTPYIKLFTEQRASEKNLWLNENIAGSYAPSSLRPDQPFRKVVNIIGGKYSLPIEHATLAYEYLLYSHPVRVADLALVLYRDYGLTDDVSNIFDIINIFAYEFGYSDYLAAPPNNDFRTLFRYDGVEEWNADLLELI